jgi:hypothetical protein
MSKLEYCGYESSPAHRAAQEYYALCDEARSLGIPTSLDDERSPRTVEGLRRAVEEARAARSDEP